MKTYIIFEIEQYYPSGGLSDAIFITTNEEEAINKYKELLKTYISVYSSYSLSCVVGTTIYDYNECNNNWEIYEIN